MPKIKKIAQGGLGRLTFTLPDGCGWLATLSVLCARPYNMKGK
ncbi:MAG: hypothetical protein SPL08_02850 [Pseudomonadota bacterium]|nr:hypothetical protein [Pseudomonadota bacterium]